MRQSISRLTSCGSSPFPPDIHCLRAVDRHGLFRPRRLSANLDGRCTPFNFSDEIKETQTFPEGERLQRETSHVIYEESPAPILMATNLHAVFAGFYYDSLSRFVCDRLMTGINFNDELPGRPGLDLTSGEIPKENCCLRCDCLTFERRAVRARCVCAQ